MRTIFSITTALFLAAGPALADDTESTPLVDDRIVDQTIAGFGDTAELAFVLYEDVALELDGICESGCRFEFKARNGELRLTGVDQTAGASGNIYVIDGKDVFDTVDVFARSSAAFNSQLRSDLRRLPRELLPAEAPGS